MRDNKKIVFESINEALEELNAVSRGRYFLCTCPECKKDEAFMYKNNVNFIQCNRENECGERIFLQFREKESEKELNFKKLGNSYPELSDKQVKSLDWANRAFRHIQEYVSSEALDSGYRGISKEVTKDFVADLSSKEVVSFMFEKLEPLLDPEEEKNYSKSSRMCQRNLVFPIHGDDGSVERILLRSSLQPDLEPKEVQLIVNPSKQTRDFFIDVPEHAETIVISEAILDGMSFKEIDRDIGIMALTGSAKTRGLSEYIRQNKHLFANKEIILAMDDDKAGWKANQNLMLALEESNMDYQFFLFPNEINDPNDLLRFDRERFEKEYQITKESFLLNHRDFIDLKKSDNTVVICDSRLDAVSFRSIDSNIGVIGLGSNHDNKSRVLANYIIENEECLKGKQVLLALENDREGNETMEKLTGLLDMLELKNGIFDYSSNPNFIKNPHEFSKLNFKMFSNTYYESLSLPNAQEREVLSAVEKTRKLSRNRCLST